jgi:DNA-binding transcriptional regulator LsrR (DeoR family)
MQGLRDVDDVHLVEVCNRFVNGVRPTSIAEWLSAETNQRVSREEIYPLIREAIHRGFFAVLPPVNHTLSQRIADRYRDGMDQDHIHVVSVSGESARDLLPSYAADLIHRRVMEVETIKDEVRIGLGGGTTMMRVAQSLSARFRSAPDLPRLGLHVVTAGFAVKRPRTAPITFLTLFDRIATQIDYVGLFAPAVVEAEAFEKVKTLPGVKESFDSAKDIDLVVTSLAAADDEHGELNEFLSHTGSQTESALTALQKAGWVGDLHYYPYSSEGPITDVSTSVRSVSLFDLEALTELAAEENKHVIVVAGPCGRCGKTKETALRPLLDSPRLKVWTDIVMDLTTARELLKEKS